MSLGNGDNKGWWRPHKNVQGTTGRFHDSSLSEHAELMKRIIGNQRCDPQRSAEQANCKYSMVTIM